MKARFESRGLRWILPALLALAVVGGMGPALWADEDEEASTEAAPAETGKIDAEAIYIKRCAGCHGVEGAGDGPAAERYDPRPRDFRRGLYKYRSATRFPTDADLVKVIAKGLPGTGMPGWEKILKEAEIRALIPILKGFSRRFSRQKEPPQEITVGSTIALSEESIEKGKQLYREIECFKCHGDEGRGDGPSAPDLTDDWDHPIRPRNLTKGWTFRGGHSPRDIYIRLNTGLAGTPMPSFADSLDNEKSWHLANYVYSLSPKSKSEIQPLVTVHPVEQLPEGPEDPIWDEEKAYSFPLLGQVVREPRLFTPVVEEIGIKAVYNDDELALLLIWDDPSHGKEADRLDGIGLQFPASAEAEQKPYFIRGDEGNPVYLIRWNSDNRIEEYNATGLERIEPREALSEGLTAKGIYRHGQYRVMIRRPLQTGEAKNVLQIREGSFIPISYSAWDGATGEGGGRIALSSWYYLYLKPPAPPTLYLYPTLLAIAVIGFEWWVVRKGRNQILGDGARPK